MKMLMGMWRRRKMMRLRRMMLRRKTDPKTGEHTLREPAQGTCTWTFHKGHRLWKFTVKMGEDTSGASVLCELVESKCTWTFHNSHFVLKFTGEMAEDTSRDIVLREPAQSKCTWIFHNSHCVCVENLQGKCQMHRLPPRLNTRPSHLSQEPLQCGHTVWGKRYLLYSSTGSMIDCK